MLDFLTASPSVGSYRCDPMTVSDIDAHPDRDRIWATIEAVKGYGETCREDGYSKGAAEADEAVFDAEQNTWDDCEDRVEHEVSKVLRQFPCLRDDLRLAISSIPDCLK